MSRQRECLFIEPEPNRWYMVIDDSNIAHQWDWRDTADCYGPFPSEQSALHELNFHTNPGGFSVLNHGTFKMDEVYNRLIRKPIRPKSTRYPW